MAARAQALVGGSGAHGSRLLSPGTPVRDSFMSYGLEGTIPEGGS